MTDETQFNLWEMGYRGTDIDEVVDWVRTHPNTVVVDVRFAETKPPNNWAQQTLRERFGDTQYRHFRSLGNKAYKTPGKIQIDDLERGLQALLRLMKAGKEPILLCACERYGSCHRSTIVNALEKHIQLELRPALQEKEPQTLFPKKRRL